MADRSSTCSDDGEVDILVDAADTLAAVGHADLDVALVTPGGVPGVLDEPVVGTVLGTVADCEDSMVKGGAASVT